MQIYILQYIFKLENVSMKIKDQVTMTLIHVLWITSKWTTLFMQAHLIFEWSVIWYIEICMSSTCFYFCLQYECCAFKACLLHWKLHIYQCKYLTYTPNGQLFLSIDEKFWKLLSEFVDTFEIYIWRKKKRKI
jgi:hypothetical protein